MQAPQRVSVDLATYPDLVMILLGFRVKGLRGLAQMRRIGTGLARIKAEAPEGMLSHEGLMFGWNHIGIRQYWQDLESLERFTRSDPHKGWWADIKRLSDGAGFWHETYHAKGGFEALYLGMPQPVGLARFAPARRPVGPFMSARARIQGGVREAA